jgi:predicted RNA-binding protein YlqC (UPF0109 family)
MSDANAGQLSHTDEAIASLTDLLGYLTASLVDAPETAEISAERRGNHIAVRLELPEEHLGQVIGRGGRIARSLRTALMVAGSRYDVRVSLDIEATAPQATDA